VFIVLPSPFVVLRGVYSGSILLDSGKKLFQMTNVGGLYQPTPKSSPPRVAEEKKSFQGILLLQGYGGHALSPPLLML